MTGVEEQTGVDFAHELVFCSRSGPPTMPWLEPDVNDRIKALAGDGVTDLVLVPLGFVSDHMEVIYDLDTEALATAAECGVNAVRVPTPGVDPRFVAVVRDLVLERARAERGGEPDRATVGRPGCLAGSMRGRLLSEPPGGVADSGRARRSGRFVTSVRTRTAGAGGSGGPRGGRPDSSRPRRGFPGDRHQVVDHRCRDGPGSGQRATHPRATAGRAAR